MKFELKRLSQKGIESAVKKAEHYRLLNEPRQVESICLDVLSIEPGNQDALILMLLARTDQFVKQLGARVDDARELLPQLSGEYEREYYAGLICERWAKAQLSRGNPGSGALTYDWLRGAMEHYQRAEELSADGNVDPTLRWNACARVLSSSSTTIDDTPTPNTQELDG